MNITAYDWRDLTKLYKPVQKEPHGSCAWDKENNSISYLKGNHHIEFAPCSQTLEKEIINSLPLQFALLNSVIYGSTSEQIIMPDMLETQGFQHAVSILVKCYQHVNPQYKSGEIYAIMATYILPYAKKVFKQLLVSQKLHPCILFLASRASIPPLQTTLPETLYEVHEAGCDQSVITDEVQEFAAFLKTRSIIFDDMTTFACAGYSIEDLAQNPMINCILAQFSRSFYIEQTETKSSIGFYLY